MWRRAKTEKREKRAKRYMDCGLRARSPLAFSALFSLLALFSLGAPSSLRPLAPLAFSL